MSFHGSVAFRLNSEVSNGNPLYQPPYLCQKSADTVCRASKFSHNVKSVDTKFVKQGMLCWLKGSGSFREWLKNQG